MKSIGCVRVVAAMLVVVGVGLPVWAESEDTFGGTIVWVAKDHSSFRLADNDENELAFVVTVQTSFTVNGEPVDVQEALYKGDEAVVSYRVDDTTGDRIANAVAVSY